MVYFEYLVISPDRNEKPGTKKVSFCSWKTATNGSTFYSVQKQLFCEDLNVWLDWLQIKLNHISDLRSLKIFKPLSYLRKLRLLMFLYFLNGKITNRDFRFYQ